MSDERDWRDFDDRLRDATRADGASVARALRLALSSPERVPFFGRHESALALLVVIAAAGAVVWREARIRALPDEALTIRGDGSLVVVEGRDGRRWIVGPSPSTPQRDYVIVVGIGDGK